MLRELIVTNGGSKPRVVLAATHDVELVDLLADLYVAHYFGDEIGVHGLTFDHRLRAGRATTRNAIALLGLYGAPGGLITTAIACAERLDRERGRTTPGR